MKEGQELVEAPETAIKVFDKFEAEIVEFEEVNSKMKFDLATEKGITDCTAYLLLLRKVEIRIDKTRKEKGASLRKAVTDLNANAKVWHNRVHTMYEVHDEPLAKIRQAKLDAEIDKMEKEKTELKAAEEKREADLKKREAATNAKEAELKAKENALNADQIKKDLEEAERIGAANAVIIEKQRQADEASQKAEDELQAKIAADKVIADRQANTEHRKNYNNLALEAITAITGDPASSLRVVKAIVKGEIPNVTMNY